MSEKRNIGIIFGPNGAGKGTVSEDIAKKFGYTHVNMGNLVRDWIEETNNHHLQQLLDEGVLIEDPIIEEILIKYIEKHHIDNNNHLVVEGFPRKKSQVKILKDLCDRFHYKINWIVVLNLPIQTILDRVADRVMTPDGQVYHLKYNPPPTHFKPEELIKRPDDRPEVVQRRYDEFILNTLECLSDEYFKDVPIENVDASPPIPEVFESVEKFVGTISM